MNRQLYCTIVRGVDTAPGMAAELVQHGFIHSHDSQVNDDQPSWLFRFFMEGGGHNFKYFKILTASSSNESFVLTSLENHLNSFKTWCSRCIV